MPTMLHSLHLPWKLYRNLVKGKLDNDESQS